MSNYRKRISAALCALAFAVSCLGSVSAAAVDEFSGDTVSDSVVLLASGDVAINESNFPDATFRQYVSDNLDTDNSGILSQAELDAVTEIDVSGTFDNYNTIADLTGIGHFAKLQSLNCSYNQIIGIDLSKNIKLTKINGCRNQLTSLNISSNTALETLLLEHNPSLGSIDVSKNTALKDIDVLNCGLTVLDVTHNTHLEQLACHGNSLTYLNTSNNPELWCLCCRANDLTSLDLRNNRKLQSLYCDGNSISELDLINNTQLITVIADEDTVLKNYSQSVTSLSISGFNGETSYLWNDSTRLTDGCSVAKNSRIQMYVHINDYIDHELYINGEKVSLDGKLNGDGYVFYNYFDAAGSSMTIELRKEAWTSERLADYVVADVGDNIQLYYYNSNLGYIQKQIYTGYYIRKGTPVCVRVEKDDMPENSCIMINGEKVEYHINNDGQYQIWEYYVPNDGDRLRVSIGTNVSCDAVEINETTFPDATFRQYVSDNFDTDNSGGLSQAELDAVTFMSINPTNIISDLTGIEYFTKLENLYCHNNQLTSLDVSKNIALTHLTCGSNQLTSLDVSKNTALVSLYCNDNNLTTLNVSKNTALTYLNCCNNQLITLDVSKNTALKNLSCHYNQLTTLDVSKNTALEELNCCYNQLTTLDANNNPALIWLECSNNLFTNLDLSKITALGLLYCENNQLTSLDVSKNTKLHTLQCSNNQLANLDVSKNIYLYSLSCNNNRLTSLDLSNNTELEKFNLLNNTYPIGDVIGSYSLDNLPAGFDPSKASNWTGAAFDAAANSLKNFTTNTVTYDYDCGYGDPVTFTLTASSYTAPIPEKTVPVLNVTPVSGGAEVTWDAIPGASMYWLYVFGTNGLVTETPVFGTSAAVTGLTPGQSYGFVAISYINGAWDFNWTIDDLAYAFIPPERTVPKLNVTSISGGVNVSWDAVPGAGMYWLYVFGDNGLVTETPVFGTSQTVMGLTPGQGYAFVAISYINGAWDFNWTADDLVYAFVPPERTVPVLNVTPVSGGANVSWDAVPGADMYWLYVFGSNGLVTEMPVYSIYGTSTTVIGLTSGQGYAFVAISYINGAWDFNWTANDLVYAIAG